jgi:hypothetical protein
LPSPPKGHAADAAADLGILPMVLVKLAGAFRRAPTFALVNHDLAVRPGNFTHIRLRGELEAATPTQRPLARQASSGGRCARDSLPRFTSLVRTAYSEMP